MEYYDCVKETSYYVMSDGKSANYFRYCKYHETSKKLQRTGEKRKYSSLTSTFFEMYSIPKSLKTTPTVVQGVSYQMNVSNFSFSMQGAIQFQDASFCVLDFNNGMLFFAKQNNSVGATQYQSMNYFVKYFYDQKYLNMFIQRNVNPEFTIQNITPDYLVINSQNYIISYALLNVNTSNDSTNTIQAQQVLDQYPNTVSVARFVESVKAIHANNRRHNTAENSKNNKNNNRNSWENELFPNIMDVESFRSIRYDFDEYLYYIQIRYVNQDYTHYLLINRVMNDLSTDINMDPQMIELDEQSSSQYSKLFHYSVPGLFNSDIRSRVRLFEAPEFIDSADGFVTTTTKGITNNLNVPLSIRTYSWKSPEVLDLYTQVFSTISACEIQLTFNPKPFSKAVGKKQTNVVIHLIPRDFTGVISKQGSAIQLSFENPKPFFEIKDWFFGAAVRYNYTSTGSSPTAQMNLIYSSTTNVVDATALSSGTSTQNNSDSQSNEFNVEESADTPATCHENLCQSRLLSAVQAQNSYYIFYQSCNCMFWFEKCTLSDKKKTFKGATSTVSTPVQTPFGQIPRKTSSNSSSADSTGIPTPTSSCTRSKLVNITSNAEKVLFDGKNILISQSLNSTTTTTTQQNEQQSSLITKIANLIYIKVEEVLNPSTLLKSSKSVQQYFQLKQSRLLTQQLRENPIQSIQEQSIPITRKALPPIVTGEDTDDNNQNEVPQSTTKKYNYQLPDSTNNATNAQNTTSSNRRVGAKQINLSLPQKINLGNIGLDDMHVYSIPNTNKYSVITQSKSLKLRTMCIFSLDNNAKDISFFSFSDPSDFQDSFDVSLLDQGILFASSNAVTLNPHSTTPTTTPGKITVYKVNFVAKSITVDRYFTQSDMVQQIEELSINNFKQQTTIPATSNEQRTEEQSSTGSNGSFISNPSSFMQEFAVKIWRADESKTYRLLLIDYANNCIFDYFLFDLVSPVFIRQVNLFNFTIIASQSLQITNNMMSIRVQKDAITYLIALDITAESINQIKSISKQDDERVIISLQEQLLPINIIFQPFQQFSQVQSSMWTPYEEGSLCGVSTYPIQQIQCIFNPFIQLSFDFITADNTNSNSNNSTNSNRRMLEDSSPNVIGQIGEDKRVLFSVTVSSQLDETPNRIILHTNFSNFDTELIRKTLRNQAITYNVTAASSFQGDDKRRQSFLDTSFVEGSIEQYSMFVPNSSNSTSKGSNSSSSTIEQNNTTNNSNNNNNQFEVQGYVNTKSVQTRVLEFNDSDQILRSDRNPYQLVGLTSSKIIVINQNLKFEFDKIFEIEYSNIKVRLSPLSNFISASTAADPVLYTVTTCDSIYSNQVESSATTETYRYVLLCSMLGDGIALPSKEYITFEVDVNPFSSLLNQAKDWNRAMTHNVQLVKIAFFEENLKDMIDDIQYISILSITDSFNNIGGYIFLIVRLIKEAQNSVSPSDNTIYILWGKNSPMEQQFNLQEIDQINSPDLDLNYISVKNFVANFPAKYPNQSRLDANLQKEFVFNIAWDDGNRYIFVSLLKLILPPSPNFEESVNQKQVFSSKYQDIYSNDFSSFIKPSETWTNPLTPLKSTITFHQNDYNANVLITNEFSIIEFSIQLSPKIPSQKDNNIIVTSGDKNNNDDDDLSSTTKLSAENMLNKILIYTQYAWCENQFSNDQIKQQILKYDSFLIIQCQSVQNAIIGHTKSFILKVYKILDSDSVFDEESFISNISTVNSFSSVDLLGDASSSGDEGKEDSTMNNVKYSMVQSIEFEAGQQIDFMSFRMENLELYLDLIVNDFETNRYSLHQYKVNSKPILVYPADVVDGTKVHVCVRNKYTSSLCSVAVLSNVIVDTHDLSVKEWMKFIGLICVPIGITLVGILGAFLRMKKKRIVRKNEFMELLMNASEPKSKSDGASVVDSIDIDAADENYQEGLQEQQVENDEIKRQQLQARTSRSSRRTDDDIFELDKNLTLSERALKKLDKKNNLRNSVLQQK